MDLYAELAAVIDVLDANQVAYALVGGLAVSLYTEPRATEDIDFMIPETAWEEVRRSLRPLGFAIEAGMTTPVAGGLHIRRLTKLAPEDSLSLDFLLPGTPELRRVLEERVRVPWQGRDLWLASVRGLRMLKRLRGSTRDLADLDLLGPDEGTGAQ